MPEEYQAAQVAGQLAPTSQLRILQVARPPGLDFVPGQFTKLGLPQDGEAKPLARAYSFVNPPAAETLEFCYDVLAEGGNLTPRLASLDAGDEVLVSMRPNGLLTLANVPEALSLFMIATGTGIGPFVSILQADEEVWDRYEKVALLYSARRQRDLLYDSQLAEIAALRRKQFAYVPVVTRERVEGVAGERVTKMIASGALERRTRTALDASCQFMLCGNPAMVQEVCALLQAKGLERNRRSRPGNVTIEKYW